MDSSPPVGLWPKIPLNNAGTRIDPAISEPIPNNEAPLPISAPLGINKLKTYIFVYEFYFPRKIWFALQIEKKKNKTHRKQPTSPPEEPPEL